MKGITANSDRITGSKRRFTTEDTELHRGHGECEKIGSFARGVAESQKKA
jgi:hypothetical protein